MSAAVSLPPVPEEMQIGTARIAVSVAGAKAQEHMRRADDFATKANAFGRLAQAEREQADHWLDVALAGARKIAGVTK